MELLTKADLQEFRKQLLEDLRRMMQSESPSPVKCWLKNAEVRKLLGISSNTIQRWRVAGKLRSTKVGGSHYYRYQDIEKLLNSDG